jgi:UDP-N-acetyl-2-amino-2-deoxyglucuronate dehydrogenase
MKNKVKFALLGCGKIAKKHLEAIKRIEAAEAVAVCDSREQSLSWAKENYGLAGYADPHKMLKNEDIDVITILTPSGSHAPLLLELVEYGKHFVIEKPLALRLADADRAIEACDKKGINLHVVQQNRFNKPIQALKKAIDSGRLGKMVMGTVRIRWARHQQYYEQAKWRGTWAHDGGVLTNQASHHIDMLTWLMGDVETVMARTATRLLDIEVEDTGAAVLQFTNGAVGIIEATIATRPKDIEGSVSVLGEGGSVEIGGFSMNELKIWQFENETPEDKNIFDDFGKNPSDFAWNHEQYLRDVVESISNGRKALIGGFEGRKSLELINAIYESAETGKMIPLRFRPEKCKLGIQS